MIIAILIATMFGVSSAFVAKNKGEKSLRWFVIGFLLGPFGLLISLLACGQRCPECDKLISKNARVCAGCGYRLKESQFKKSDAKEINLLNHSIEFCPNCGSNVNESMKFCRECGHLLPHKMSK